MSPQIATKPVLSENGLAHIFAVRYENLSFHLYKLDLSAMTMRRILWTLLGRNEDAEVGELAELIAVHRRYMTTPEYDRIVESPEDYGMPPKTENYSFLTFVGSGPRDFRPMLCNYLPGNVIIDALVFTRDEKHVIEKGSFVLMPHTISSSS